MSRRRGDRRSPSVSPRCPGWCGCSAARRRERYRVDCQRDLRAEIARRLASVGRAARHPFRRAEPDRGLQPVFRRGAPCRRVTPRLPRPARGSPWTGVGVVLAKETADHLSGARMCAARSAGVPDRDRRRLCRDPLDPRDDRREPVPVPAPADAWRRTRCRRSSRCWGF